MRVSAREMRSASMTTGILTSLRTRRSAFKECGDFSADAGNYITTRPSSLRLRTVWPPLPDLRRLLEGVSQTQDTQVIAMPAHNLNADRQPFWRKTRRH